jgi:hypothetical protein
MISIKIKNNYRFIVCTIIFSLALFAQYKSPDSPLYITQSLATAILVWIILKSCRSPFIVTSSLMFIAGNWLKITFHKIYDYKYTEPTGFFSGTASEWETFYSNSTIITAILIAASMLSGIKHGETQNNVVRKEYSKFVYHAAIFSTIFLYAINYIFGIYRIGLGSKIELPLGLTAPLSFLIFIGTPLIIALSADCHVKKSKNIRLSFILFLCLSFLIASISTLSRAVFIIQMLPIVIGMAVKSNRIGNIGQGVYRLALPFIAAMIAALMLVSAQRIVQFTDAGIINDASVERYFNETIGLVVNRWVGAESMMVASSTDGNMNLFLEILNEDPKSGVFSAYHDLSNSNYSYIDGKTFLNLPGYFALISFSGSPIIILIGSTICCLVGISFENWVSKKFNNSETIKYTSSTLLSYHFSQMAFPLLFIPFIIQLLGFLYFLELTMAMGARTSERFKFINPYAQKI